MSKNSGWIAIQRALDEALSRGLYHLRPSSQNFFTQLQNAANQKDMPALAQAAGTLADPQSNVDARVEAWLKIAALNRTTHTLELQALLQKED